MTFAHRAVGVLLSGVPDDGVRGLAVIRERGGSTVVQDPGEAIFAAMPMRALDAKVVDHTVPTAGVGRLLTELAGQKPQESTAERDPRMEWENRIALGPRHVLVADTERLGAPLATPVRTAAGRCWPQAMTATAAGSGTRGLPML